MENNCIVPQVSPIRFFSPEKRSLYSKTMSAMIAEVINNFSKDKGFNLTDLQDPVKADLIYERAFGLVRAIISANVKQDFSSPNLPASVRELTRPVLNDLALILKNKDEFKRWHKVDSTLFERSDDDIFNIMADIKSENQEEQTDGQTDETMSEEEDSTKKEFDKGANEEDPYEGMGDLKVIFRYLIKSDYVDGDIQAVRNIHGLPELAEPSHIYALLASKVNGVLSENELISKLTNPELLKTIPEMKQMIGLLGIGSEQNKTQRDLWIKMQNLFAMPYISVVSLKNVKGNILAMADIMPTTSKIEDVWRSNYDTGGLYSDEQFQKLIKDKVYIGSGDVLFIGPRIADYKPTNEQSAISFLNILGINPSAHLYTKDDKKLMIAYARRLYNSINLLYNNNAANGYRLTDPLQEIRNGYEQAKIFSNQTLQIGSEATTLANLLQLESNYSKIFPSLSRINADGERQYAIANNGNISKSVNVLNKAVTVEDVLNSSPFGNARFNPQFNKSRVKKLLFNEDGSRTANSISLEFLSGSEISGRAITYKKSTYLQKLQNDIAMFALRGKTDVPRLETSNSFYALGILRPSNYEGGSAQHSALFDISNFYDGPMASEAVMEQMIDYLNGEIEKIKAENDGTMAKSKRPGKFNIFSFLINSEEDYNRLLKDGPSEQDRKAIQDHFNDRLTQFNTELNRLGLQGILPKGMKPPKGITIPNYENAMKNAFVVNSFIQNLEFAILFSGDPTYFKIGKDGTSEWHKRIKGLGSTGTFLLNSPTVDRTLAESDYHKMYSNRLTEGIEDNRKNNELRSLVINDIIDVSTITGKNYQASDGQGFVTPDAIHDMLVSLGLNNKYTDRVFKREALIYKRDIAGKKLTETEQEILDQLEEIMTSDPGNHSVTVIKGTYFGNIKNSNVDAKVFDKFSLAPLFPSLVKHHPKMRNLLRDMVKNNLDYLKFATGTKGFVRNTYTVDQVANADADILYKDMFKLQITTSNKMKKKTSIPTQLVKLIFSGLFDEGQAADGPNRKRIEQMYKDYVSVLTNIQKLQVAKMFKSLGFTFNPDGSLGSIDYKYLSDRLLEEAIGRDMNDKIRRAVLYNPDTKRLSGNIETGMFSDINKLVAGVIDKTVRRYKMNGGDFVLITNALGNNLNFYKYQEGDKEIQAAETFITLTPEFAKLFNKIHPDGKPIGNIQRLNSLLLQKQWKEENIKSLTIVLDRVPTQETNSMDIAIVKQFIDPIMGTVVMLPREVVVKSGTDFDFDKEKVLLPNFDSRGNYIEFTEQELDNEIDAKLEVLKAKQEKLRERYNLTADNFVELTNDLKETFENKNDEKGKYNKAKKELYYRIRGMEREVLDLGSQLEGLIKIKQSDNPEFRAIYEMSSNFMDTAFNLTKISLDDQIMNLESDVDSNLIDLYNQYKERQNLFDSFIEYINNNKALKNALLEESKATKEAMFEDYTQLENLYNEIDRLNYAKNNGFENNANAIIRLYRDTLLLPEKYKELLKANDVQEIQRIARETGDRLQSSATMPPIEEVFDYLQNLKVFSIFFNSKNMLAPYAKSNTYQQLFAASNTKLNTQTNYYGTKVKIWNRFLTNDEKMMLTDEDGKMKIGRNTDVNGNPKQDMTSQKINATVDAAKDPYFAALQITYRNVGVDVLLSNIFGYSPEYTTAFLTQPALLKYADLMDKGLAKWEAKAEIYRRWGLQVMTEIEIDQRESQSGDEVINKLPGTRVVVRRLRSAEYKDVKAFLESYNSTNIIPSNIYINGAPLTKMMTDTVPSLEQMQTYSLPKWDLSRYGSRNNQTFYRLLGNEIKTVAEFLALEQYNSNFKKVTGYLSFDTSKVSSLFDNIGRERLRKEVITSGIIDEDQLQVLEKQSPLSAFNNTNDINFVYSKMFPTLFKNINNLYRIIDAYNANFDARTSKGTRNIPGSVANDFIYSIIFNFGNSAKEGLTNLLDRKLSDRIKRLKINKYYKTLARQYPVLEQLIVKTHRRELSPAYLSKVDTLYNIHMIKSTNMSSTEENAIISQFENLYNQSEYIANPEGKKEIADFNTAVKGLVTDIFKTGLAQSGLSSSFFSYSQFLPTEFTEQEYTDALDKFNALSAGQRTAYIKEFATKFKYNSRFFKTERIEGTFKTKKNENNSFDFMKYYRIEPARYENAAELATEQDVVPTFIEQSAPPTIPESEIPQVEQSVTGETTPEETITDLQKEPVLQEETVKVENPDQPVSELTEEQKVVKDFITDFLRQPHIQSEDVLDPKNAVMISGPGGTGKTYTITRAVKEYMNSGRARIAFSAPTHNAKRELQKSLNDAFGKKRSLTAQTNASLFGIEFDPISRKSTLKPRNDWYTPPVWYTDVIVLDEYSMLGGSQLDLMKQRLEEMAKEGKYVKIIYTGDYAQIPPVLETKNATDFQDGEITNLIYHNNKERVRGLFTNMRAKYQDVANASTKLRGYIDRVNSVVLYKDSQETLEDIIKDFDREFVSAKSISKNMNYYNDMNKLDWMNSYLDSFRKYSADNLRFGVIVNYNNAEHQKTIQMNNYIRKALFNTNQKFVIGDLLMMDSNEFESSEVSTYDNIIIGKEERMIIKSVTPKTKKYNFRFRNKGEKSDRYFSANIPIYELQVLNDDNKLLKVDTLNSESKLEDYFRANGLGLDFLGITGDFPKNMKQAYILIAQKVANVNYAYVVNSHKVQGSSYDQTFVEEDNILAARNFKERLQLLYTAYSRSKFKTHTKTVKAVADQIEPFENLNIPSQQDLDNLPQKEC